MRIIHLHGFSEEERLSYKSIIYNNTISSMRVLCQACQDLDLRVSSECDDAFNRMLSNDEFLNGGELTPQIAADIKLLWADPGIKEAFARSSEFQLNDSAG